MGYLIVYDLVEKKSEDYKRLTDALEMIKAVRYQDSAWVLFSDDAKDFPTCQDVADKLWPFMNVVDDRLIVARINMGADFYHLNDIPPSI
jgi:hypothetical protein